MKLDRNGEFLEFETPIGDFAFEDVNGAYLGSVTTTGEFWRCIELNYTGPGLTPKAARDLARLLLKAAKVVEHETGKLDRARGDS